MDRVQVPANPHVAFPRGRPMQDQLSKKRGKVYFVRNCDPPASPRPPNEVSGRSGGCRAPRTIGTRDAPPHRGPRLRGAASRHRGTQVLAPACSSRSMAATEEWPVGQPTGRRNDGQAVPAARRAPLESSYCNRGCSVWGSAIRRPTKFRRARRESGSRSCRAARSLRAGSTPGPLIARDGRRLHGQIGVSDLATWAIGRLRVTS